MPPKDGSVTYAVENDGLSNKAAIPVLLKSEVISQSGCTARFVWSKCGLASQSTILVIWGRRTNLLAMKPVRCEVNMPCSKGLVFEPRPLDPDPSAPPLRHRTCLSLETLNSFSYAPPCIMRTYTYGIILH